MGFFDEYPYRNLTDLNLDYLEKRMKVLEQIIDTFVTLNTVTFADPIIWNITTQYARNTVVLDTAGNAYLSKEAVPAGVQLNNEDYWLEIFNFTEYTRTANQNLTINVETNTTRATAAYAIDDWLIWNDVLYKVTAAIAIDDALIIGTNIVHFTVEDFIKAFMAWATNTIQQYKNDIDASELLYRQQLAIDISNTTASLQAQLNAAIAGVTVDSEVINARIGEDGVTYPTLGDSIRSQIKELKTVCNTDILTFTPNTRIMTNTSPIDPTQIVASGYGSAIYPCSAGDKFTIKASAGSNSALWLFVDSAYNRLSYKNTSPDVELITAPLGAAYVIFNCLTAYPAYIYKGHNVGISAVRIDTYNELVKYLNDSFNTEFIPYDLDQRINTNIAPIGNPIFFIGFASAKIPCVAGDKFTVWGTASTTANLYCFIDSSGNRLEWEAVSPNRLTITAPPNAAYLVVNANMSYDYGCCKGVLNSNQIAAINYTMLHGVGIEKIDVIRPDTRIMTNTDPIDPTQVTAADFGSAILACSEGDQFTIKATSSSTSRLVAFVDSSYNILQSHYYPNNNADYHQVTAPANSAYVIFNVITLYDFEIYRGHLPSEVLKVLNFHNGDIIATFGDSITWYDGRQFGATHSESGQLCVGYQSYMRKLGAYVLNYGESGYTMPQILTKIRATDLTGVDLVIITAGANDFRTASEPLGAIAPIGSAFDESTYIGAMQAAIEYVINNYNTVKVILCTPIKGWSGNNLMPETYPDAVKAIAKLYSLPVCDWYYESGVNDLNKNTFIGDDEGQTGYLLHPTNAGFKLMGEKIVGTLQNN